MLNEMQAIQAQKDAEEGLYLMKFALKKDHVITEEEFSQIMLRQGYSLDSVIHMVGYIWNK